MGIPSSEEDTNAPRCRVQRGLEEIENLRRSVESHCKVFQKNSHRNISFSEHSAFLRWEPYLKESYDVADAIFEEVLRVSRDKCHVDTSSALLSSVVISFPSMSRPNDLEKISAVLQSDKCKKMLGLEDTFAEVYPLSPAPYIRLIFSPLTTDEKSKIDPNAIPDDSHSRALFNTEKWVNSFLGKYRLCPYTSSVTRAAVGLSSVGVPVGRVHVKVACTNIKGQANAYDENLDVVKAAQLVSAFWSETVNLLNSTQEEWATSLIVFPEYDEDFDSFVDVCDSIIEPTVVATQSTDFIGRAWFHPQYDADVVGHSDVIAGHAIPHKMVKEFMRSLYASSESESQNILECDELLVKANNRVRQTPHATINILRRSQLTAAEKYEKGLGGKRPKPNSIYVRNAMRLAEVLRSSK